MRSMKNFVLQLLLVSALADSFSFGMDKPKEKSKSFVSSVKEVFSTKISREQATQKLRALSDSKDDKKISVKEVSPLLAAGADIEVKNSKNKTILERAVELNKGPLVTLLLARGANPNNGMLLVKAVENNYVSMAQQLINAGTNVDQQAAGNPGALYNAVYNKNVEIVALLVKSGADVSIQTAGGSTPLHVALQTPIYGPSEKQSLNKIIKILIDNGADIHKMNAENKAPLDLAKETRDKTIINLFANKRLQKLR